MGMRACSHGVGDHMFSLRMVTAVLLAGSLFAAGCEKKNKPDPNEFKGGGGGAKADGNAAAGKPAEDKAGGGKGAAAAGDFKGTAQYLPHPEVAVWKQG